MQRLSEIRAAIVGEVRDADDIGAARSAIARMFESFVLHRATSRAAPKLLHAELALGAPGFVIEPVIRSDAIQSSTGSVIPILKRQPLDQAANNQRQEVGYRLVEG